jgi:hypothetical protein
VNGDTLPLSERFNVKTAYSASDFSVDERPKVLDMLDRKRDIDQYVMVEEQWRFERLGIDVTTWEGWTAAYRVTNFTPTIVFDTRAPVVGSNDTVTNALRLWLHAWETRNITDLYAYADESQREAMDRWGLNGTNPVLVNCTFARSVTNCPIVTVLSQGESTFETNNYAFLFVRRQEPIEPRQHSVFFCSYRFKRQGGAYLFTPEIDVQWVDPVVAFGIRLPPYPFTASLYTNVVNKLTNSPLPRYFYTIP